MFFDILACFIVNVRHAASLFRPLYHVSVVPGMLDGPAESGERVQSPTLACAPSLTTFQASHSSQTHWRQGDMLCDEMREDFELMGW